jgi:GNAT superfamily N-acetyltransferase
MGDGSDTIRRPKILLLAEAPFAIPTLSRWFVEEWAPWYGPGGQGDASADLLACCNHDHLPLALVALDNDDQALGTAALKPRSLGSELGYGPWLAAVLVGRPFRRQGIANALIGAMEDQARRLNLSRIYVSTNSAVSLVTRRGWIPTGDEVGSLRGRVSIFSLDLRAS